MSTVCECSKAQNTLLQDAARSFWGEVHTAAMNSMFRSNEFELVRNRVSFIHKTSSRRSFQRMPDKKRKRPAKVAAATLGDLEGDASRRVSFLRTDARAAVPTLVPAAPLKEAFHSDLDPRWVTAAGASTAAVLSRLSEDIISTVASADGSQRRAKGIHLGRASVCRLLRRRALSAAVLASDAGPPLAFAHVAVLAQESGAHVALLSCGSSHLGQQFGLLRASAIGLEAAHFPESHPFVQLIKRTARPAQPLPWLDEARAAVATKSKPE